VPYQPRCAIFACSISRTRAQVVSTPAEAGAHTQDILRRAGYSDADIDRFRATKIA
jgi:crotonobetainyl-CoA:carnitine CoA-transferase CaiB-like acyl-CoA transferase